tara:strand:+ start:1262 stop:1543 length:282 start_codon:yes stop_codon:yes gene_type:complete
MTTKEELKQLCEIIDKMDPKEHIEILKIIKKSSKNINITENNNGCFINMNTIDEETVKQIEKYVIFFKEKEKELKEQELTKNNLLVSLNDLDK